MVRWRVPRHQDGRFVRQHPARERYPRSRRTWAAFLSPRSPRQFGWRSTRSPGCRMFFTLIQSRARARVIPRGQRFAHDALQPVRDADGQDVLSVTAVPRGCPDRFGIQGQFLESLAALGKGSAEQRLPVLVCIQDCSAPNVRAPARMATISPSRVTARRPSRPARPVPDRCWPCPGRCARPGGQGAADVGDRADAIPLELPAVPVII